MKAGRIDSTTPTLRQHTMRNCNLVMAELTRATDKFPEFHSAHEGIAVLEEEFFELKELVYTNPAKQEAWGPFVVDRERMHRSLMRAEAVQTAAMALRFLMMLSAQDDRADDAGMPPPVVDC